MHKNPTKIWEWIDHWREVYYKPTVKPRTFEISEYNVRIIKKHLKNQTLKSLDPVTCQLFLNRLYDEGYAKATIKKCNIMLSKSLQWAQVCGLIKRNPTESLIIPKAHTKKVYALTQNEQVVIEKYCENTLYGDFILFLFDTGLRVGEMINLRWSDFNAIEKQIYIRESKTESGVRTVPLIERAYQIILKQTRSEEYDHIFLNKHRLPISYESMKKCTQQLRQKADIPNFTPHVCRHTFATRLIERGANPKSVSALLGHRKVEYSLNIYTDMEEKTLKKDIYLLDESFTQNNSITKARCLAFISEQYQGNIPEEFKILFKEEVR